MTAWNCISAYHTPPSLLYIRVRPVYLVLRLYCFSSLLDRLRLRSSGVTNHHFHTSNCQVLPSMINIWRENLKDTPRESLNWRLWYGVFGKNSVLSPWPCQN